ncbi:MAG: alpha-N-acetylglucosaminidase [Acidobacteriota bacterium]
MTTVNRALWLVLVLAVLGAACAPDQAPPEPRTPAEAAARALAGRLLPDHAESFVFEEIAPQDGRDVFEVESRGGRIVVRGSNGVAMASGLNWYLKNVCRCLVSVAGDQLAVPTPLPPIREKVRIRTPYKDRYFFNYCTFSYTMAWWDWPRWERLIDWLALNGINMPLAVTGQEAVWVEVLRDLGFDAGEIGDFLVGPAYLPWGWMGNIDGLGGPLPESWIRSHAELERKILARERELGMAPVLQGFTGHVPPALQNRYPGARIRRTGDWSAGFSGTYFLDPTDSLFRRIGRLFIEKQTALFGTDHLYAADTFNEMDPPSGDPNFLRSVSAAIYGAMAEADPRAVWVLQGWFLYYSPAKFWTEARSRAFLGAVPDDRMIVLDLFGDQHPIWDKFQAFYGKPWIWNVVHNFGGKTSLNGDLPKMAANLAAAIGSPERGRFAGIGMMMEGFGDNPVVQELIMDMVWRPEVPPLGPWIRDFARRRYGSEDPAIAEVWDALLDTVYKTPVQSGSLVRDRPGLYDPKRAYRSEPTVPYDPRALAGACRKFLSLAGRLGNVDTYRLDAVNLTRQVLSNVSNSLVKNVDGAYRRGDLGGLRAAGRRLLGLIEDLDALLGTREEFLLGRWLADAKRWAADEAESRLLEWNARNLITLWGPQCTEGMFDDLNGYAQKQWSGLFRGYDLPRWKAFLEALESCLRSGRPFERANYVRETCSWEQAWSRGREIYPAAPGGDPLGLATALLKKYEPDIFGEAGGPAEAERKKKRRD